MVRPMRQAGLDNAKELELFFFWKVLGDSLIMRSRCTLVKW